MSNSRLSITRECARRTGFYAQGTPTGTLSTTSWQQNGARQGFDEGDVETLYRAAWAKVEEDSAGTPLNVGEVARIKSYTPSTGTFTVPTSSAFTNAMTATMTVGLYLNVPPSQWGMRDGWTNAINRVLRSLRYRRYSLLTLITDGDMETSGVTNWTAGGSPTLTKVTAAANVSLGAQALSVQSTVAADYARSALVNVAEGDVYVTRCDLKVSTGTATLQAYDETNSAAIESESTTYKDWRFVDYEFTVPADCHQISMRLVGTGASDLFYADNLSLRPAYAQQFALPSWVDTPRALEALRQYWGTSVQGDAYMASSQTFSETGDFAVLQDVGGATAYIVQCNRKLDSRALLVARGLAAYGELASDTATTEADLDLVVSGACALVLRDMPEEKARYAAFAGEFRRRSASLPRWTGWQGGVTA